MTFPAALRLALVFARRELRGGTRGFRVFLGCLFLGVAAIAAVGSLGEAVSGGLARDARAILGGDIDVRASLPLPNEASAWIAAHAERVSTVIDMRAMAVKLDGGARQVVQLRAVDDAFPLYGALGRDPSEGDLATLLATRDGVAGAIAERSLAIRLDLRVGDRFRLGDAVLALRGLITREPDRAVGPLDFGPRLIVAREALPATGLVRPGTLSEIHTRARLPAGADSKAWMGALDAAFPDAGWRLRDYHNASPNIERLVERIGLFLSLVGLTALLVGGIGVGNAVAAYLDAKTVTIATLKCLGAPARVIFMTYLALVLTLALGGIAAGALVGAATPFLAAATLGEALSLPIEPAIYGGPLALSALFGLLTTLLFSLWPLGRARNIQPTALFRDAAAPARGRPPLPYLVAIALTAAALAGLAILTSPHRGLAAWFVAGTIVSVAAFQLSVAGLLALARRLPRPRGPRLGLALGALRRPGSPAGAVMLSLGLGLTVLVTIALIQGDLASEVGDRLPNDAPTFFFIDVQSTQIDEFNQLLAGRPGVSKVTAVPSFRGRISRIKGVPVARAQYARDVAWAVDGDRGLTYAAALPEGSRVTAGQWWAADHRGAPEISIDSGIARGMGVGVGDTLTLNVLGRDIEARVANLRDIDWTRLGINFTVIFAPGTLEAAPHTYIATARVTADQEEAVVRAVTDRLTNVSAIRVKDALDSVAAVLGAIGGAARVTAGVTLLAGVLVLAGAMVAGHRRRVHDAVILKVLGATRADVTIAYLLEYGVLGLATALLAGGIGTLSAWLVIVDIMHGRWSFDPLTVVATLAGSTFLTMMIGMGGTWWALRQKPAPLLRNG